MDINQLKQYMDFYTQYGPQPLVTGPGGDSTSEWNRKLMLNNAFNFAMQQQGPQQNRFQTMPDYFGNQPAFNPPAYTPPTSVAPNPYPGRLGVNGGPPPDPMPNQGGLNYLRQALGLDRPPVPQFVTAGIRG